MRGAGTVAVHGLGREGRSLVTDLATSNPGAEILVLDDAAPSDDDRQFLADAGATSVVGPDQGVEVVGDADVLVRSPGVPPSHAVQVAARAADVPVTTVLNVFFARHRPTNVVAITGTKGKSTTTTLLGHLLGEAGRTVRVAGNVGTSVLDLDVAPSALDHLVLELSSYQLADLRGRPSLGLWLNLHRDHHGWHGGGEAYAADKGRIVALSDRLIVNGADDRVLARSRDHRDRAQFDASGDPIVAGRLGVSRAVLRTALESSRLVGTHNLANLAAVVAVGADLGVDPAALLGGLASFRPLPHRLELVHDDGRRWVDDSIATIPEATVAALDAFPDTPVTLLAGGFDRDQDHAPLLAVLATRAGGPGPVVVVALPDTGHRLAIDLAGAHPDVAVRPVPDLAAAVAEADRVTPRGGVVLLSPAAASFNQFRSFEDRGHQFATLARARPA
nr:UDP-N-acetylmuramoyl-L-alanine--D-glutamate ligase [Salsipaludibacter albus]